MAKQESQGTEMAMRALLAVRLVLVMLGSILGAGAVATGQEAKVEKGSGSALGVRQERVELMTSDLQRRFAALIQTLQKTDAAKAERLQATLEEAKKLQLTDRMKAIAENDYWPPHRLDELCL